MIKVRNAVISDAAAIVDFQLKMAWETEKLKLVTETVTRGVAGVFEEPSRGQYFVAETEGEIIASLLITYEWSDWRNSNVWWFQSVYVLPGHRRTGVFRKMYSVIKEQAEMSEIPGLRLYVESNNERARKTYEALSMNSEHYTLYEWFGE